MSQETGHLIRMARELAGLTQSELAKRISVSPQYISQYERGLRNPKKETLQKIAQALNVAAESLDPDNGLRAEVLHDGTFLVGVGTEDGSTRLSLMRIYEYLTTDAKRKLLDYANYLYSNPQNIDQNPGEYRESVYSEDLALFYESEDPS